MADTFCFQSTTRKTRTEDNTLEERVARLAGNQRVQDVLRKRGLVCQKISWEDTSRNKNSCYGRNISDMTLKVGSRLMPMIRSENFTDTTVDLTDDKLPMLVVGNENGSPLKKVTLREYLENFEQYCGARLERTDLYDKRDSHVLTSAQACVLPAELGTVDFAVNLYNYQSGMEPAVLVIMATAHGTSAQVVCGGNTELYFNENNTSRLFTAERLTEYRASQGKQTSGPMTSEEKALNGIYIFQVPLKVKKTEREFDMFECCAASVTEKCCTSVLEDASFSATKSKSRGMERAILKLGQVKGPYKGILKDSSVPYELVRDREFPVRLTVQFYMCSDTDEISNENLEDICSQIRRIYDQGLNEGSLVVDRTVPKPGLPNNSQPGRPTATSPGHLNNSIL